MKSRQHRGHFPARTLLLPHRQHQGRATDIALNEFLLNKAGLTWDAMPEPKATLDDIDPASVERFLRNAKAAGRMPETTPDSTRELFEKLRLIQDGQLTRAAVVLFGKDPGRFYHSLSVKLGRFANSVDIRFKAGYIDSWGRGIEKITHACIEHGCPKPNFEITPTGVLVTLMPKFSMAPQVTQQETPQDGTSQAPVEQAHEAQVGAHEAPSNPTSNHQVTQQVRDLLNSLDGEMTRLELMTALKLKDRVNFTKNYLKPALENGLIEMTQPNSPNSPTQKYRRAANGKQKLHQQ